jgi:hypothetical protein
MSTKTVTKTAKVTFATHVAAMRSGLENELPAAVKGIPINGQLETPAQVEQAFQSYLDADSAVQAARTALKNAITARLALTPPTRVTYEGALSFVKSLFAGDATKLAACGISEKPRTKLSAAAMAAGVARRQATLAKKQASSVPAVATPVVANGAGGQSTSAPEAAIAVAPVAK